MSTHKDTSIYNASGFHHLSSNHPFDLIQFSGTRSSKGLFHKHTQLSNVLPAKLMDKYLQL